MFRSIRTKVVAVFICMFAAILAIAAFGSYWFLYRSEHAATDFVGIAAAQACSASFSYLAYDDAEIDPDSARYRQAREELRSLCQDSGMTYLYAYDCDIYAGTVTYFMCVAADDADDARIAGERGYGTVVNVEFSDQQLRALRGESVPDPRVVDNQYGAVLSWYDKVGSEGTMIAGADYSVGEQRARVFRTSAAIIALIALAMLALLLAQMRVLQTSVFRPLRAIAGQMKEFGARRSMPLEALDIRTHDEMGEIAGAFSSMTSDINAYLDDIERLTTERVQGQVELDVARRIQLGMVPTCTQTEGPAYQMCAIARPARQVGGDFYDCLKLDDGKVAVVIGDVSGKGVAAALFMAMAKTMIREDLALYPHPAVVLNRVNEALCLANPEGMFVTAFAAVLDPATGQVRFANAGHVPPLAVGGQVRRVDCQPGTLLGLFDDVELHEGSLVLGEGEALLLFTDGVTEAASADEGFLGDVRLERRLAERAPYADARSAVEEVVELVEGFTAGREQFDDLTVVALMRRTGEGAVLPIGAGGMTELAVDIAAFEAVRDEILATATGETFAHRVCLACEEAFANIVSHSGAQHAWFAIAADGDGVSATLADDGAPFDPTAAVPVERQFEDLDGGGMGIGLIRQMSSGMTYRREQDCNVLELRFDPPR